MGAEPILTALFKDARSTQSAYDATITHGYDPSDINLMMSEETRQRSFTAGSVGDALAKKAQQSTERKADDDSVALEAEEAGGPVGGTMGTLAPAAAAVGTVMLLPGLLLAGPVAVALAAAGAVGLAGGLIGALTHWGIPKSRVEEYEQHIRDGGVLMGVKPRSQDDAAWLQKTWTNAGGVLVHQ